MSHRTGSVGIRSEHFVLYRCLGLRSTVGGRVDVRAKVFHNMNCMFMRDNFDIVIDFHPGSVCLLVFFFCPAVRVLVGASPVYVGPRRRARGGFILQQYADKALQHETWVAATLAVPASRDGQPKRRSIASLRRCPEQQPPDDHHEAIDCRMEIRPRADSEGRNPRQFWG